MYSFCSALRPVKRTLEALTIMTKSPVSMWGANIALCLPRSRRAASVAIRPKTRSDASRTHHWRWMCEAFGEYVFTGKCLVSGDEGYRRDRVGSTCMLDIAKPLGRSARRPIAEH